MSVLDGIDTSDPCAVLPPLRNALYRLLAGEHVVYVRVADEAVRYQEADTEALRKAVGRLENECKSNSGRGVTSVLIRSEKGW